jgi:hypothetical protein
MSRAASQRARVLEEICRTEADYLAGLQMVREVRQRGSVQMIS